MTIEIGLCCNEAYAPHTGVTIYSILTNSKKPADIRFYILGKNIGEQNKLKIQNICKKFNSKVFFLRFDNRNLKNLKKCGYLGEEAYFRLFLPQTIPRNIRKILYLDSDIIVLNDISELFNKSLDGKTVAAVPDIGAYLFGKKYLKENHIYNPNNYFNSGLILIDTNKWKDKEIAKLVIDYTLKHEEKINFADQDGLNYVLKNDWLKLPYEWNVNDIWFLKRNYIKKKIRRDIKKIKAIHYTSTIKPWKFSDKNNGRNFYWKYLSKTPWSKEIEPNGKIKSFLEVNKRKIKTNIPFYIRLKIKNLLKKIKQTIYKC